MIKCGCQAARTFWYGVEHFCKQILSDKDDWLFPRSIIFGINRQQKLLGEATRAFIRHAIRWWYAAMREIDIQGGTFVSELVMLRTVQSYRESVVRYAVSIRKHYIHRVHTKLVEMVSEETRTRFSDLVSIQEDGTYSLTPAFEGEISKIQDALDQYRKSQQP